MEDRPYCNKSICNVDWYYNDGVYCNSVGYSEVKCNEQIEKLKLIEKEYSAMSRYDEMSENAVVLNEEVANNKKKTAAATHVS